jgi:hypothetical protein
VTVRKHTYVYSTNSVVLFLLLRPYMGGTASATLQSKSSTFCKSNPYTQKVRPHSRPSRKPRSCYAKTFRPWRSSAEKIQKDISGLSQRSRRDPDLKSVEPDSMSVRSEYDSKTVCFSCSARTWDSKQAIHFEAIWKEKPDVLTQHVPARRPQAGSIAANTAGRLSNRRLNAIIASASMSPHSVTRGRTSRLSSSGIHSRPKPR